jgi:LysM repeat protein
MQLKPRALVVASFGVAPLLLAAGCGSESTGSQATLANIQGSSYVTIPPATTTTTVFVPTTTVPGVSAEAQSYTVVAGDSVFRIASLFDVDPEVLANFNSWPEGIQHPILPGDVVNIPPGAAVPGVDASDDGPGADDDGGAVAGEGCTHTIELNENPTRVARKYDITYEQLQAANPFMDFTTTFIVGDVLTIPPEGNCD